MERHKDSNICSHIVPLRMRGNAAAKKYLVLHVSPKAANSPSLMAHLEIDHAPLSAFAAASKFAGAWQRCSTVMPRPAKSGPLQVNHVVRLQVSVVTAMDHDLPSRAHVNPPGFRLRLAQGASSRLWQCA